MAINLNDNLKINAGKPIDSKYFNDLVPYTGITEVNNNISISERHIGLTVNILGIEYWYATGVTNTDLVLKTAGSSTGSTDIINVGSGEQIFVTGSTGTSNQLRTLIGDSGTNVQTSGDTIIISSSNVSRDIIVTTGTSVNVSSSSVYSMYVASGTTGYTLPSSPTIGSELIFTDGLGNALTNNIVVNGNGNNIQNDTTALINSDYGTFTIIFNGTYWTVVSHVP